MPANDSHLSSPHFVLALENTASWDEYAACVHKSAGKLRSKIGREEGVSCRAAERRKNKARGVSRGKDESVIEPCRGKRN